MSQLPVTAGPPMSLRHADADNLKVLLVACVIGGHTTMAWTDNDPWVLDESPVPEPLLTVLKLSTLVALLFAMALFFLIAGKFTR